MEALIQKYRSQLLLTAAALLLAVLSSLGQFLFKKPPPAVSLDEMIPQGFVLIPVEIQNSEDIIHLIGRYGVVDLYSYSSESGLPREAVGHALKVIPASADENRFAVIAPEKEALYLLERRGPFYAVVQNPKKTGSQIYKKRIKKQLRVIEEGLY